MDNVNFYAIYNPGRDKFLAIVSDPDYDVHHSITNTKYAWVDDTIDEPLNSFLVLPDGAGFQSMVAQVQQIFGDREAFDIMEFVTLQFVLVTHTNIVDIFNFHFETVVPFADAIQEMHDEIKKRNELRNLQSRT